MKLFAITWMSLLFLSSARADFRLNDLLVTPSGTLCVAGAESYNWEVRCSWDSGETWATVDQVNLQEAGISSEARKLVQDTNGNIYAGGIISFSGYLHVSVIRMSSDGGKTWKLTDHLNRKSDGQHYMLDLDVSPRGTVFVSGAVFVPNAPSQWFVKRLLSNWTQFQYSDSVTAVGKYARYPWTAQAQSIAFDSQGHVYVLGTNERDSRLLLRKSTDDGSPGSWQTTYAYSPTRGAGARGMKINKHDRIFIWGHREIYGSPRAFLSRSSDGGKVFTSLLQIEGGEIREVAFDEANRMYVSGETRLGKFLLTSSDEGAHWNTANVTQDATLMLMRSSGANLYGVFRKAKDQSGYDYSLQVTSDVGASWRKLRTF